MTASLDSRPGEGPKRGSRCGTTGGRMAHRRRNEPTCGDCAPAWAAYMRRLRARHTGAGRPLRCRRYP